MKFYILMLVLVFTSIDSFSQEEKEGTAYGWAWSWHTGPFLPSQIPNVTEIQPSLGLRFSFPKGPSQATEYFLSSSNANGVTYYNFAISSKTEVEMDGLYTQVYVGLDALSYKIGAGDFQTRGGGHFGLGLVTKLGGHSHFRMDMKFNVSNPGTSMYLGFGLEMRYPVSAKDDKDKENEG